MKKILSVILAMVLLSVSSVSAFASTQTQESRAINFALSEMKEKYNEEFTVKSSETIVFDDVSVVQMFIAPVNKSARMSNGTGHAVHVWSSSSGKRLAVMQLAVDFEYDKNEANVVGEDFYTFDIIPEADYTVTSTSSGSAVAFGKAFHKVTYKFKYDGKSKSATLEVNCTKSGTITELGGVKKI